MSGPPPTAGSPRAGPIRPRALTLAITGRCNLRCRHCLVESGPDSGLGHVAAETAMRVVRELAALGGEEIWLTGGEPLGHPRWSEILASCGRQGFRIVGLQTNGVLLGEPQVEILRELQLEALQIQVSLDGASPLTHDLVRGPGSFAGALAGIRRLAAAGLAGRVTIAFTEMRHNMEDLAPLLELVAALGLGRLRSATLVRSGRAASEPVAPPEPVQVEALLDRYLRDARFRALVERHGEIAAIEWWRNRSSPGTCCCTLGEHPYLAADGTIAPCALMRAEEFAVSGWPGKPLAVALGEGQASWSRLEALRRERPARLLDCRGCPGELHCAGGCMGRAHASSGELISVEDRCALRRAVYGHPGPEAITRRQAC